ncbi:hypothetical protein ACI0FM_03080 [Paenochrobactrum sp. BZR 588]|uniref:hypothetical protein n=1 Tax=unclassified Paenochrobactrum TaxID=2639760 RepID=UPI00385525C8
MKILQIRPVPKGAGNTVARFDVELENGVKLFRLQLVKTRNGTRVYGPKDDVSHAYSLPIELADQLAILAQKSMGAVANVRY